MIDCLDAASHSCTVNISTSPSVALELHQQTRFLCFRGTGATGAGGCAAIFVKNMLIILTLPGRVRIYPLMGFYVADGLRIYPLQTDLSRTDGGYIRKINVNIKLFFVLLKVLILNVYFNNNEFIMQFPHKKKIKINNN